MLLDQVGLAGERRLVDFEIVRLHDDAVGGQQVAVFNLADITDDDVFDWNLSSDAFSDNVELLIELDFRLKAAKLPFFRPVIKCSDKNNNDDGDDDRRTFDPFDIGFFYKGEQRPVRVGRSVSARLVTLFDFGLERVAARMVEGQAERNDSTDNKDNKCHVLQRLEHQPKERLRRFRWNFIAAKGGDAHS